MASMIARECSFLPSERFSSLCPYLFSQWLSWSFSCGLGSRPAPAQAKVHCAGEATTEVHLCCCEGWGWKTKQIWNNVFWRKEWVFIKINKMFQELFSVMVFTKKKLIRWEGHFFTKNIFKMMWKGQKGFSSFFADVKLTFLAGGWNWCVLQKLFLDKYISSILLKYLEFSRWWRLSISARFCFSSVL